MIFPNSVSDEWQELHSRSDTLDLAAELLTSGIAASERQARQMADIIVTPELSSVARAALLLYARKVGAEFDLFGASADQLRVIVEEAASLFNGFVLEAMPVAGSA